MPYTIADSITDERDANDYERSRVARARRARERALITDREFQREIHEATAQANNMRAVIIRKLIHAK